MKINIEHLADFKILTFEEVQLPVYGTELMNQGSFLPVSVKNSFILGHHLGFNILKHQYFVNISISIRIDTSFLED
jgi:hypothetical protein